MTTPITPTATLESATVDASGSLSVVAAVRTHGVAGAWRLEIDPAAGVVGAEGCSMPRPNRPSSARRSRRCRWARTPSRSSSNPATPCSSRASSWVGALLPHSVESSGRKERERRQRDPLCGSGALRIPDADRRVRLVRRTEGHTRCTEAGHADPAGPRQGAAELPSDRRGRAWIARLRTKAVLVRR